MSPEKKPERYGGFAPLYALAEYQQEANAQGLAHSFQTYLALSIESLSQWDETLRFYKGGGQIGLVLEACLDWFSAHPESLAQAEAVGVFSLIRPTTDEERMEAEMIAAFRVFVRKCLPLVFRRGYHRVLDCTHAGGGFSAGMNEQGERDIVSWFPPSRTAA